MRWLTATAAGPGQAGHLLLREGGRSAGGHGEPSPKPPGRPRGHGSCINSYANRKPGDTMHLHVNFGKRLIGAAGIACAAALIPVAALAATAPPPAPAASTPGCAASGLALWVAPQLRGGYAVGYF